ncbi:pantoate--beta-alanine ligase [Subsaxibacter sp. CAU 1640]|nr:pantoate--beta-alanine ligase [Subsaxibacter sp. CAU 1640]MCK7589712.1 pantoate--beta-alanine ligase [Subsaxibacter sp. CAU 1640]
MFCYIVKVYNLQENISPIIEDIKKKGKSIGFVPTMGALHKGHLSLIEEALKQNDVAIMSIFVNPTQFNNQQDLEKYPRTMDRDLELLKTVSDKIIVYAPTVDDIYGENIESAHFDFDGLEFEMEGKFRPGHFDGVGTIVKRLFEIIQPTKAYFGKKDFQQYRIIQKLVENYNIPVSIVGCEIYREKDGLAMSSRNERLNPEHRKASPFIYKVLKTAKEKFGTKSANEVTDWVESQFAEHDLLELEYFIIADEESLKTIHRKSKSKSYRAFIAVYADDIRLIDNIALN